MDTEYKTTDVHVECSQFVPQLTSDTMPKGTKRKQPDAAPCALLGIPADEFATISSILQEDQPNSRWLQRVSLVSRRIYRAINGMYPGAWTIVTDGTRSPARMCVFVPNHMMLGMAKGGGPFIVTLPCVINDPGARVEYTKTIMAYLLDLHGVSRGHQGAVPVGNPRTQMMWHTPDDDFADLLMLRPRPDTTVYILDGLTPWRQDDVDRLPRDTMRLNVHFEDDDCHEYAENITLPPSVNELVVKAVCDVAWRWLSAAAELPCLTKLTTCIRCPLSTTEEMGIVLGEVVTANSRTLEELHADVDDTIISSLFPGAVIMSELTFIDLTCTGLSGYEVDGCIYRIIRDCPNLVKLQVDGCDVSRETISHLIGIVPIVNIFGDTSEFSWDLTESTCFGGNEELFIGDLEAFARTVQVVEMFVSQQCRMSFITRMTT